MQSGRDRKPVDDNSEHKGKKTRRGTRGKDKCKPLYGKPQKTPTPRTKAGEETDKAPFTERLSDLSEEQVQELDRLTAEASSGSGASSGSVARPFPYVGFIEPVETASVATPSKATTPEATARALKIQAKRHARPSSSNRPESPERPEINKRVAQLKLESSLFAQRQYRRAVSYTHLTLPTKRIV